MTAKRFIVDDCGTLIDMNTRNTYDYVSDVCGLLNELNEENHKLQNELETYKSGNVVLKKTLDKYEKVMRKHNIGSIEKLDKLLTWERRL